jgi:hypothetical protein
VPTHYDNPLRRGLVFILDDLKKINEIERYNDFDKKQYLAHKARRSKEERTCPMLYKPYSTQFDYYFKALQKYTSLNCSSVVGLVASYVADSTPRASPVAYFELESGEERRRFPIDFRRFGRYIVVKLIDANTRNPNNQQMPPTIDVRYMAFYE